jgi:hypothetical protein
MYCNTQVTFDASTFNARSESAIAVNPGNPSNIVGSSKRFTNPQTYDFSLAAYASFDGGTSWVEAPPLGLLPGWAGVSDPTLAWDGAGNVYLVGLAFGQGANTLTQMRFSRARGSLGRLPASLRGMPIITVSSFL